MRSSLAEGLQNWIRGKIETHPEVVAILLITYLVAFAALGIGMSDDRVIKKFRHLPLFVLIGLILASGYVISQVNLNGAYGSDSLAFAHYAAILFVKGVNPYGRDLQDASTGLFSRPAVYYAHAFGEHRDNPQLSRSKLPPVRPRRNLWRYRYESGHLLFRDRRA